MTEAAQNRKEALSSTRKPDLSRIRSWPLNYVARVQTYGDEKYSRANYLAGVSKDSPPAEIFKQFREYLRANVSHALKTLDAMERHQATDPALDDVEGMKLAMYAPDTDPDTTGKVGPSMLPHVAAMIASGHIAVSIAVQGGMLPEDPGQTWSQPEQRSEPTDAGLHRYTTLFRHAAHANGAPGIKEPVAIVCNCVICREKRGEVLP